MSEHHCACSHHHSHENVGANENGVVEMKFVEEMRDRSIVLDERFKTLAKNAEMICYEYDDKPEPNEHMIPIGHCSLGEKLSNHQYFEFKWAYSNEQTPTSLTIEKLISLDLPNNIDSVVEYEKGFNIPLSMLFGIFGGIAEKLGNVENIIVHEAEEPEGDMDFFFLLKNEPKDEPNNESNNESKDE